MSYKMCSYGINLHFVICVLAVVWVNEVVAFPTADSTKCHCVFLKNCDFFNSFIDSSNDIPLITSTIKEAICDYDGSQISVCCPTKSYQKRHAKEHPKLDYLDELTGLNCPPSFGKEYDYDEYLKEHNADSDKDDSEDDSSSKEEPDSNEEWDPVQIYCNHWGNCGRFKFPKDDGHGYQNPTQTYPQPHGHDFRVPFFPYQHHHYHDHHSIPQQLTPSPDNKNSIKCGTLSKETSYATSSEVYPWIARLAYLNTTSRTVRHRCLGTIISDQHVLTAAHCVDKLVKDLRLIYARVGDDINYEDFKIIETLIHPAYNEPLFNNDVALIKLAKTHNSRMPIVKVCLPQNDSVISMGSTGIVAGWSENGISNVASTSIRYINLPILNNTECAIRYAKYSENFENSIVITPREFCAKAEAMNDVCEGDSGGPFMDRSESGSYTLLGIVAFGPKTNCGQSNLPGVYMRVSAFVEWIQQNIT